MVKNFHVKKKIEGLMYDHKQENSGNKLITQSTVSVFW